MEEGKLINCKGKKAHTAGGKEAKPKCIKARFPAGKFKWLQSYEETSSENSTHKSQSRWPQTEGKRIALRATRRRSTRGEGRSAINFKLSSDKGLTQKLKREKKGTTESGSEK